MADTKFVARDLDGLVGGGCSGGMETVVRSRGMVLVWIGSVIRSKFVLRNVSLDFYQTRKELGKVAPSILPPVPVSYSASLTPSPPLIK